MGSHFLNVNQARPRISDFDDNKNFAHALIWTCVAGNIFFYYTKGHAVSFTNIFTHAVGNCKQTYFLGWPHSPRCHSCRTDKDSCKMSRHELKWSMQYPHICSSCQIIHILIMLIQFMYMYVSIL